MTLDQSHIVIFGGSSGIGLGVARACLERGARVTLVSRSPERLKRASDALTAGDRVSTRVADIGDEDAVARVLSEGTVDHVVSTAISPGYAPIQSLDLSLAQQVIASKLLGAIHVAKHARLPPTGSLVFTSGIASDRPMRGGSVVAAVNGALDAFVRALALELAPARVNAVSPGWVDTPAWDQIAGAAKAERLEARAKTLPVGRVGEPRDIAHAVIFLLESGFTTGEVLHVDGGHRFA